MTEGPEKAESADETIRAALEGANGLARLHPNEEVMLETFEALRSLDALVAERDRYKEALQQLADGDWNLGKSGPLLTCNQFAREALTGSTR